MTTRITQLGSDLEQIIAGVEMRRRARRNWMQHLMIEHDDAGNDAEFSESSDCRKQESAGSKGAEQAAMQAHGDDTCH